MRYLLVVFILTLRFGAPALALGDSASAATAARAGDPIAKDPPAGLVPDNLLLVGNASFHPPYLFVADKEARTLTIWGHEGSTVKLVGSYPMDIGKNSGDKVSNGDAKTPEGIYFIQDRLETANTNYEDYGIRAFPLDYPNFFDRFAGKSGSGIWLHAIPETKSLLRGSRGCVVVRNEIITKITSMINVKRTPVIITDKVNYITPEELARQGQEAKDWLESWRASWANKDIDNYISHYADNYKGQYKKLKMNKAQWRSYKAFLNKQYKTISVTVRDPVIISRKDEAIIHFIQDYKSAGINDSGEKTLFVKRNPAGKFEILTEVWGTLGHDVIDEKGDTISAEAKR